MARLEPRTGGIARFEGNDLCLEFTAQTHRGPVLRNPGGTSDKGTARGASLLL